MKKDLQKKLKSYSLTAGAVIAAGTANSQVVYTDINPDITKTLNGDFYDLDLNNDATADFNIYMDKSSFTSSYFSSNSFGVYIDRYGSNSMLSSTSYYARALNTGDIVGPTQTIWTSTYLTMVRARFYSSYGFSSYSTAGLWGNVTDKYLGLKLVVSGQTHYGWARLDVNTTNGSFTIKDYAYDATPNQPILAGAVPADVVTAVTGSDIGNNSNGSDLEVSFTKAADENTVDEYRIMAVKSSAAGSFDLAAAQAVSAANYTALTPNGSDVSTVLSGSATDTDGDPIEIGTAYKIFVLSTPDGVNALNDALSDPSGDVTLNTAASPALGLDLEDVDNIGTAQDMQLSFVKAANENGIAEYRAIIVKSAEAGTFNLADAQGVATGNYTAIVPNGSNIQQTLNNGDRDRQGDLIAQNTPYRFFVLSVADGSGANIDSLSDVSNEVILLPYTGIEETALSNVNVYANRQQLTIDMGTLQFSQGQVRIMDMSGKLAGTFDLKPSKTIMNLNVENGMYMVRIEADNETMTRKVLLNR